MRAFVSNQVAKNINFCSQLIRTAPIRITNSIPSRSFHATKTVKNNTTEPIRPNPNAAAQEESDAKFMTKLTVGAGAVAILLRACYDSYISYYHMQLTDDKEIRDKQIWEKLGPFMMLESEEPSIVSVFGGKLVPHIDQLQIDTNYSGWKLFYKDVNNSATDVIPYHVLQHYTNVTLKLPVSSEKEKGTIYLEGETYDKKWKMNKVWIE